MIFPGMDPYLERPAFWPGFHNRFIVYLADHLQPLLRPRYIAAVEERVFVEGPDREIIPDVRVVQRPRPRTEGAVGLAESDEPLVVRVSGLEIHEAYVEILDRQSGLQVVTVIELVSPSNKRPGAGRDSYKQKQREVLHSQAHLVEIDLLRDGRHVLAVPESVARREAAYDYLIAVNRAGEQRDVFDLYPRTVRDRLPRVRVPLAAGDADVPLDVQVVLQKSYEAGAYEERINYAEACSPLLTAADEEWAAARIQAAKGAGPA
jgi:hypothetical protein